MVTATEDQRTTAEKIASICPKYDTPCPHYHPGMGDGLDTKCYGDHESCQYYNMVGNQDSSQ